MNVFERCAGPVTVDAVGDGPPLLLLPANGRAAADFAPIRATLAETHRSVALDWPAMGLSPAGPEPSKTSAALLASALEEVVDALELAGPVTLMGHSVGGFAAARLAARRPDLVSALVLVDSGGFAELGLLERTFCRARGSVWLTRAIEARFARYHTRVRTPEAEAMIARVEAARLRPGYAETVGAVWRSFAEPDGRLGDEAHAISAPTLLVWGARDPVIPLSAARAAEGAIAGSRLVVLDTGHTPFLEAREDFLAAVLPFLAAHSAARVAA